MTIRHKAKKTASKAISHKIDFYGEVEFGVLSKNCNNFGICKISKFNINYPKYLPEKKCKCKSTIAAFIYLDNDSLEIRFLKKSMCIATARKYFSEPYFKIEENYLMVMPSQQTSINEPSYLIKTGAYFISESPIYYSINV